MPFSLLGTDAIMFSVFKALGLRAMVGPVLGDEAWDEWAQIREERLVRKMYEAGREEESDEEMGEGSSVDSEELKERNIEVEDEEDDIETARVGKAWWRLKMVATDSEKGGVFKVGGEPSDFINQHYPIHPLPNTIWLNESSDNGWEVAMANLKSTPQATPKATPTKKGKAKQAPYISASDYEEKTELMWQYSHAAIFVEIPPYGAGVRGSPRQ
ncbi:hypothetical protein M7I_1391 [Glarea lozoyensis 74030]|nr:hypothetical protein M7I_1391 [Glarea lozoyensis 74030]